MTHDRVEESRTRRKPEKPGVSSRPERRGSLDRVVARIDARRGDNSFGAALRAGSLVRQMRHDAELSQRELGKALGVSQARISEIEAGTGAQGPTWMLMERIAEACGRAMGVVPVVDAVERPSQDASADTNVSRIAAVYSRKSFEDASAALKRFAEVKSATEFFRLQGDFARSAFDAAVAESARVSETVLKLAGDVAEPLTSRYSVSEGEGGQTTGKRRARGRGAAKASSR